MSDKVVLKSNQEGIGDAYVNFTEVGVRIGAYGIAVQLDNDQVTALCAEMVKRGFGPKAESVDPEPHVDAETGESHRLTQREIAMLRVGDRVRCYKTPFLGSDPEDATVCREDGHYRFASFDKKGGAITGSVAFSISGEQIMVSGDDWTLLSCGGREFGNMSDRMLAVEQMIDQHTIDIEILEERPISADVQPENFAARLHRVESILEVDGEVSAVWRIRRELEAKIDALNATMNGVDFVTQDRVIALEERVKKMMGWRFNATTTLDRIADLEDKVDALGRDKFRSGLKPVEQVNIPDLDTHPFGGLLDAILDELRTITTAIKARSGNL